VAINSNEDYTINIGVVDSARSESFKWSGGRGKARTLPSAAARLRRESRNDAIAVAIQVVSVVVVD